MSILEQFRTWLQGEMKTADEGMKAETKKGLDYLKGAPNTISRRCGVITKLSSTA
jgi:hypothetical protein